MTTEEILDKIAAKLGGVEQLQGVMEAIAPYAPALKRMTSAGFDRFAENLLGGDALDAKAQVRASMTAEEYAVVEQRATADLDALAREMHAMEASLTALGKDLGMKLLLLLIALFV